MNNSNEYSNIFECNGLNKYINNSLYLFSGPSELISRFIITNFNGRIVKIKFVIDNSNAYSYIRIFKCLIEYIHFFPLFELNMN